jgi:hypothetical protein
MFLINKNQTLLHEKLLFQFHFNKKIKLNLNDKNSFLKDKNKIKKAKNVSIYLSFNQY